MNTTAFVIGLLIALYGVLLFLDRRRTAKYVERRRVLGIVEIRKARRLVMVSVVLCLVVGSLVAYGAWMSP